MAIKKEDNSYLTKPEADTGGVELDSRFFTPNTLIWGAPITVLFVTTTNWSNWQTTVDRIKAGDPRAPITAMTAPSVSGLTFSYTFNANNPDWKASTFYGDQLRIKTRYRGSITNPVAPQLNTAVWGWESSVSGLSLISTRDITTATAIFWPDSTGLGVVAADTITIEISGTGQGSCWLNYRRNNTQKREQAFNGSRFYVDPQSFYSLDIVTSDDSHWEYKYPRQVDDLNYAGTIYSSGTIRIVINTNVDPIGPTPTPQS